MSKLSREQLLLDDEWLRNRDRQVDENHRCSIERSRPLTRDEAARLVFGNENADPARLDSLMEFLRCPATELADKDLELLEFRNELMADYRLASLLRIFKTEVWYGQFCFELREYVVAKWEQSSLKNSWAQRRGKRAAEKNLKKDLKPQLDHHGNKDRDLREKNRDLTGRFTSPKRKNTGLGKF